MLKSYVAALKAQTETQVHREHRAGTHRSAKPLMVQIEDLMRTLPPAQRDRPWSIDEFVHRLQGKYRDRPHPADVGRALRGLGWVRVRDWSNAGGGRRYWSCSTR
jgi:hypothetical protein